MATNNVHIMRIETTKKDVGCCWMGDGRVEGVLFRIAFRLCGRRPSVRAEENVTTRTKSKS